MTAESKGPGTRPAKETTRVYTGRVISVDLDLVQFPDGSTGELEIVRHPGASAVIPFLDDPAHADPRILLLRQYRYAAQGFLYEIPAGRLEDAEAPRACAARELREETGYDAGRLDPLLVMFTTPGFTDEQIHLFIATELTRGTAAPERDEFIELAPRRLSEVLRMIETGAIVDAKSALALLYVATFRTQASKR